MCNWKKWIWPGILATVLLTALAMLMKSESIENDLIAKATNDLRAQHAWASVEMDGRDATLLGTAPSEEAQVQALKIADDAYDVRVIADASELLALADPFKISATKADGKIVLEGNVASDEMRAEIVAAAEKAAPNTDVVDNMTTARGMPAGFAALAGYGISQLTGLDTGSASLTNMDLTVKGAAPSYSVFDGVNSALKSLPEGGNLAMAEITAPQASPYTLSATKSAEGIVLEGFYPSDEVRASIVAAAEKANPGKSVTDNMKFSLGNPNGFGALAGYGIGQLTGLTSGSASLSDMNLTVKGVAPSSDVYTGVNKALGALPAGATLAMADITPPTANPYTFEATKGSDSITLSGFVPSNDVRSSLLVSAGKAFPGKTVIDNTNLALGNPAGFSDLANFGIAQLTTLESGVASTNNSDLTVKGIAASSKVYESVTGALNGTLPGNGKLAKADITTPTASPYTIAASKTASQITLTGFYPSSAVRAEINESAQAANPGKTVVDNLKFALGAPEGFSDLAKFGIGQLTGLDNGSASLNNSDLSVKGFASSADVYNNVTGALNGDLPGNGNLAIAYITTPKASPYNLVASKTADQIVLDGYYPSSSVRASINEAAKAANPGKSVVDNLEFALGAPEGFEDLSQFSIGQLNELKNGMAAINGSNVTVKGLAATIRGYNGVNAALDGTLPGNGKLAMKDITPPSADPYVISATETADGIVLQGYIPNEKTRARLISTAKGATPTGNVTDQMQIASGAPVGFGDIANFGFSQLNDLVSGEASVSKTDLSVRGVSPSQPAYNKVTGALAGIVPSGGKVVLADITRHTAWPYTFTATKADGVITLDGLVETPQQQSSIVALTKSNNPDFRVADNLGIAKGVPNGVSWALAMNLAVKEVSQLTKGRANLINEMYTIEGMAPTNNAYDSVVNEANGQLPAKLKLAKEDVTRPAASPYVWEFTNIGNNNATLTGYTPSSDVSSKNEKQARSFVQSVKGIDNSLQLASGEPNGFAAATWLGLQTSSELFNPTASINDNVLMVSGLARDKATADRLRKQVETQVPTGFTGKHAITHPPAAKPLPPRAPPPPLPPAVKLPEPPKPEPKPAPKPKPAPVDFCKIALTDEMKSNKINFETNKAIIAEGSYPLMDRLVNVLKSCPTASVEIGGHTDSRGSDGYNQRLSNDRAGAVLNYLVNGGIQPNRLSAVGYGENQPIADNGTKEGRAANRRIEFTVNR